MATQNEIAQSLTEASATLEKIAAESAASMQKIADLETAIANGNQSTPEVDAALAALKAQLQRVDDIVPDVAGEAPTA